MKRCKSIGWAVVLLLGIVPAFHGKERAKYSRYSLSKDRVDTCYPKIPGRGGWYGVWETGADAAVLNPKNHKVYLFEGSEYLRYNLDSDQVDPGYPKKIGKDGWFGVWSSGVDAALLHPTNQKIYFFKGSQYVRYNLETDQVDPGYPKKIGSGGWYGVWSTGLDAAVLNPNNNKVYFFKGSQYVRYNFDTDRVDSGYPKKIGSVGWSKLRAPISAAVALDAERVYFFHPATEATKLSKLAVFNYPDGKGSQDDQIHASLMDLVRDAKPCSSLAISIAGWDRPEFVDVLADAVDRGVKVRVVAQKSAKDAWFGVKSGVENRIEQRGFEPYIRRWSSGNNSLDVKNINHAKFFMFSELDGTYRAKNVVGLSSSNWRSMDLKRQNDAVFFASQRIYGQFLDYFDAIWDAAQGDSTSRAPFGSVQLSSTETVTTYFHPEVDATVPRDPVAELLADIRCVAGSKIFVSGSTWNYNTRGKAVMDQLIALRDSGCDVRILGEHVKSKPETSPSIFAEATQHNIPWGKTWAHNKYMIVYAKLNSDGKRHHIVLAGSLNFSSPIAAGKNGMLDVTWVIRDHKTLYDDYIDHWYWLCSTSVATSGFATCQRNTWAGGIAGNGGG